MPSLQEIIRTKANRLDVVPERLVNRAIGVQSQLFDSVLKSLNEMGVSSGTFEVTTANLALVDQAIADVRATLLGSDYINGVGEYSREFDRQKEITDSGLAKGFSATPQEANVLLAASKKKAVDTLVKVEFINTGLYNPIRSFLDTSVSTGASLTDTIKSMRVMIEGSPVGATEKQLGLLNRYAKQIAFDAFAQSDRQYTSAAGDELGAEWYFYAGGEIEPVTNKQGTKTGGTRAFCEVRNEKYWHKKEVESWVKAGSKPSPSGSWSGQINGTNERTIFQFLGGWNCRHTLMPVSVFAVPKEKVIQAIDSGFYSPDAETRNKLEI